MHTLPDRELARYAGVLYVDRAEVLRLLHGCGVGEIRDAELRQDRLEITWQTGDKSWLPWREVVDEAHIDLPPPDAAFVADPYNVGLLFSSETPREGLAFREPHSVVEAIGVLSPAGLVPVRP